MAQSKYTGAGVDFDQEHEIVDIFVKAAQATRQFTWDLRKIGITIRNEGSNFSGGLLIDFNKLRDCGIEKIVEQQSVDGPGSKPVVHVLYNGHDPMKRACVGIDSVAMAVNDLVCSGARPVTLIEYHAWHKPNLQIACDIAAGDVIGARLAGATFVGGENASLPTMITGPRPEFAYDMCTMAHGVILNQHIIKKPLGRGRVKEGDAVIGLTSSGMHCNGGTLVWKTAIDYKNFRFAQAGRINLDDVVLDESVAEAMLTPTIIYVKPVLKVIEEFEPSIKAIANITGEGIYNVFRVLPEHLGMVLDYSRPGIQSFWSIFNWLEGFAHVPLREMFEDYNMGIGMAIVVAGVDAKPIQKRLNELGSKHEQPFNAVDLGEVVKDEKGIIHVKTYRGTTEKYQRNKLADL